MKANELMIADWVQIANAGNAQVVMVDQYQVQSTLFERPLIDERKLEGIPITETTLDENYDWNVEGFWFYRNELPLNKKPLFGHQRGKTFWVAFMKFPEQ